MRATTFLLAPLLCLFPQERRDDAAPGDFRALRRDLDVMQRILEREMIAQKPEVTEGRAYALGSLFAAGRSEGYYVPGEGAVFVVRVPYALAPAAAARKASDGETGEPTLWDQVLAEVEGKSLPGKHRSKSPEVRLVEDLQAKVLECLAKFGANIGQLTDEHHLTVIVRGAAADGKVWSRNLASDGALWAYPDALFPGGSAVLSIRISRGDAAAVTAGKLGLGEFKKRARVAVY